MTAYAPGEQAKWAFLRQAPYGDAEHPEIRELARLLKAAAGQSRKRFIHLAHAVARDWIRQQTDTARVGGEDIAGHTRPPEPDDAVDALRRGVDDCDAKGRLFCALCIAAGVGARMVDHWTRTEPLSLKHVSAEVNLGGEWLPVELTLARATLGELGTEVPKEKDGKWLET